MLMRRRQFDADLDEEIRLHLNSESRIGFGQGYRQEKLVMRRRADLEMRLVEGEDHMAWGWEWLESLVQDTVYGSRAMLRSPALTVVALLSLAFGIGANTAIFSLLDAVMLRLPVRDPAQLILLGKGTASGTTHDSPDPTLLLPFYPECGERTRYFPNGRRPQHDERGPRLRRGENRSEPMKVQLVSGTYFDTLGVKAFVGRTSMKRR